MYGFAQFPTVLLTSWDLKTIQQVYDYCFEQIKLLNACNIIVVNNIWKVYLSFAYKNYDTVWFIDFLSRILDVQKHLKCLVYLTIDKMFHVKKLFNKIILSL